MIPGEFILKEEELECNANKSPTKINVINIGDRPIQVGSHYHFNEVNDWLQFDREKAYGKRLNVPSGAAVRFEPGDEKEIEVIGYAGLGEVHGFHNKVDGLLKKGWDDE